MKKLLAGLGLVTVVALSPFLMADNVWVNLLSRANTWAATQTFGGNINVVGSCSCSNGNVVTSGSGLSVAAGDTIVIPAGGYLQTNAVYSVAGGATPTYFANGVSPSAGAYSYQSVNNTLTAAGTTQGTCLVLAADTMQVVTTASASTGVCLPVVYNAGQSVTVINNGANPIKVYGDTTNNPTISGNSASTGISVAATSAGTSGQVTCYAPSTTVWNCK